MIATIRYVRGAGNNAVFVRLRDEGARYWDFVHAVWVNSDVSDCRVFLVEYQDSSTDESRYQTNIDVPTVDLIVEYVRDSDEFVIGEEFVKAVPSTVAGSGPNLVTITALTGITPVPSVLVQAWVGGEVVASALTDADGQAGLALNAGAVDLVLTRPSWGSFPLTPYVVVAGPQSLSVQGTVAPPAIGVPLSYALLIGVGDIDNKLLAGFSTIEVQASDDDSATWRTLTSSAATPPKLISTPRQLFDVGGLSFTFSWAGIEYSVTFGSVARFLTPGQVAQNINAVLPGAASVVGTSVVLQGLASGAARSLAIVSSTISSLGFRVGQIAYGTDAHIPLAPNTYLYTYLDPLGSSARRYRWRFSANGVPPRSSYSAPIAALQQLSSALVAIGTARFVGVDGMVRKGTLIVAPSSPSAQGLFIPGQTLTFTSDEQGFLYILLVRGARVRVGIEGTGVVREFVVPDAPTFDLLQAVSDAPDQFTVQTTPPLLTRRSL